MCGRVGDVLRGYVGAFVVSNACADKKYGGTGKLNAKGKNTIVSHLTDLEETDFVNVRAVVFVCGSLCCLA